MLHKIPRAFHFSLVLDKALMPKLIYLDVKLDKIFYDCNFINIFMFLLHFEDTWDHADLLSSRGYAILVVR